jgi:hypothetical protein
VKRHAERIRHLEQLAADLDRQIANAQQLQKNWRPADADVPPRLAEGPASDKSGQAGGGSDAAPGLSAPGSQKARARTTRRRRR